MDNRSDSHLPLIQNKARSDRRTNRTRRQLKDALFALILEKGYAAVTIEDITERADLGRTTFYLHYRDKEELLLESIDSISDELMEQVSPIRGALVDNPQVSSNSVTEAIRVVFRHAAENGKLYLVILRGEGAAKAAMRVREIITEKVAEILAPPIEKGLILPQVPVEIFAAYFAGSLLGLMTWWLESNQPYSPEEMAEIFSRMYFNGGRYMLGIE